MALLLNSGETGFTGINLTSAKGEPGGQVLTWTNNEGRDVKIKFQILLGKTGGFLTDTSNTTFTFKVSITPSGGTQALFVFQTVTNHDVAVADTQILKDLGEFFVPQSADLQLRVFSANGSDIDIDGDVYLVDTQSGYGDLAAIKERTDNLPDDPASEINVDMRDAHTLHVAKTGDNANDGSSFNQAKETIASALTAASSGDKIIIWPGNYNEEIDFNAVSKSIHLIGTNRYSSRIYKSLFVGQVVKAYDNCVFENLTIENTGNAGQPLAASGLNNIQIINCSLLCLTGTDVLSLNNSYNISIDNCYLRSAYDVLTVGKETIVKNSIIVTTGTFGSSGTAAAVKGDSDGKATFENCIIIAQPSYKKGATLYESARYLVGVYSTSGMEYVFNNCLIAADGYKPAGSHANSVASGNSACYNGSTDSMAHFKNCRLLSRTDQNENQTAYGIKDGDVILESCSILTDGQLASYDFSTGTAHQANISNTRYDSDKINGSFTIYSIPDDVGRIDVGKWKGAVPDDLLTEAELRTDIELEVAIGLDTDIPGSPTAGSINERITSIDDLTQAGGDGDLAAIKDETDKLNSMITEDGGGNFFTETSLALAPTAEMDADELATAMKAITGLTVGGTWTWEKIMKITTAFVGGDWRLSADGTKQELMDAENGTTVILEQSLTRSPAPGNKYRNYTVKI